MSVEIAEIPDLVKHREVVVYKLWDAAKRLLYIGCSTQPRMRLYQHRTQKPWWPEVAYVAFSAPMPIEAGYRMERSGIAAERPVYNRPQEGSGTRGWITRRANRTST